jgi:hypothetical protein
MIKLEYQVQFNTPAFLGNAEQDGQWRTPPFKGLATATAVVVGGGDGWAAVRCCGHSQPGSRRLTCIH